VPRAAVELRRRGTAAGLLAAGSMAGWWLAGRPTRRVALATLAVAVPGTLGVSRAAGRVVAAATAGPPAARPAEPEPVGATPADAVAPDRLRITVLIPARDEAAHLPALLGDLGRQELLSTAGPLHLRVVVIDDRSVDGTGAAAAAAIGDAGLDGWVIRRDGPGGAKGDALRDVPAEAIGDSRLLVVLDADARVASDFIRRMAGHLAAGAAAFTARRRIAWADRFRLARLQDDEQALDSWILAGRIGLGGAGELRGNGMAVTPEALAAAGGWPAHVLTEDLELSTALLAAGTAVAWGGDVVVEETAAATMAGLARQRLRWSEGSARRFLTQMPRVLLSRRVPVAARLDLALYAGQLVLPPLAIGAATRALIHGRRGPVGVLVGVYVAAGTVLAWHAIGRLQPAMDTRWRAERALAAGVFSAHWLVAVPVALARIALGPGTVTFAQTRDRLTPRPEVPPTR
jgi:hypothetical protein